MNHGIRKAASFYWAARNGQKQKQAESGRVDAGLRIECSKMPPIRSVMQSSVEDSF